MEMMSVSVALSPGSQPVFRGLPVPGRGGAVLDQKTVRVCVWLQLVFTQNPPLVERRRPTHKESASRALWQHCAQTQSFSFSLLCSDSCLFT